jgi:hypothetical protein
MRSLPETERSPKNREIVIARILDVLAKARGDLLKLLSPHRKLRGCLIFKILDGHDWHIP